VRSVEDPGILGLNDESMRNANMNDEAAVIDLIRSRWKHMVFASAQRRRYLGLLWWMGRVDVIPLTWLCEIEIYDSEMISTLFPVSPFVLGVEVRVSCGCGLLLSNWS
jgi:hypothetical protein